MKFLLLQARNPGDPAQPHELDAFREVLDFPGIQIDPYDLLKGRPSRTLIEAYDCVLVGGSGDFGMGDLPENPWLKDFVDLCGDLASRGSAMFASCFGFQALIVAGGGRVVTDKSRAEVGTFPVQLTEAGYEDPLFAPLAPGFPAQFGHKDHALEVPQGMTNLARSERCPHQALRVEGSPIYATQFHPELSMERNRERFLNYLEAYSQPDMVDTPEEVLARYVPTLEATSLLEAYVRQVLGYSEPT